MKKLSLKLGAILLASVYLVGCDQATSPATKASIDTPAAHVKADPKEDFKRLTEFQLAQNEKVGVLNQQLIDTIQSGDTTAREAILIKFSQEVDNIVKALDALPIYSPEIHPLKEKAKLLLITSSQLMTDNVKLQQNPSEAGGKALLMKRDELLKISDEFTQLNNELAEKYGVTTTP
ncbi:hypothetical protein ACWIT3_08275 [Pasteurella sp. P03HT]